MKKNICILLLIWLVQTNVGYTQTHTIDNLKHLLQIEKHDSARCLLLEQLSVQYEGLNPDTAFLLAQQGLIIAQQIHFPKGELICLV